MVPEQIDTSFFKDDDTELEGYGIYEEDNLLEQGRLSLNEDVRTIEVIIPGVPMSGSQLQFNRKTGNAYRPNSHKVRMQDVYNASCDVIPEERRPYYRKGTTIAIGVKFFFPYRSQDYGSGRNEGVLKDTAPVYVIGNKDLDNLLKPLKDGMKGVCYNDDKQIVMYSEVVKLYSESPRTVVLIKEIN